MAVTAQIGAAAAKTRKTQNHARRKNAPDAKRRARMLPAPPAVRQTQQNGSPPNETRSAGSRILHMFYPAQSGDALQLPHSMEIELKSARRSSTFCAAFASPAASNTMCPLSNMHSRVP